MIDPVSFLLLILFATGLAQVYRPRQQWTRLSWLVAPGLLLLFVTHPLALLFSLLCAIASLLVFLLGRAVDIARVKARLPYVLLLPLFVPDVVDLATDAPLLWLGSAFFIIRQMMTVAQGLKTGASIARFVPSLLLATWFFAALPSGPVFNGLRAWDQLADQSPPRTRDGLYRLFEGFVYLFAVAGFFGMATTAAEQAEFLLTGPAGFAGILLLRIVVVPLLAFGFLFATFYGYSRMAEGTAFLFGFEVPQNFNKPHLARDLGDFWKRWHRSMADFVMQYIYLPLLVTTSNARLALLAAFVFMGLWHDISLSFLAWGAGHGLGLAVLLPWAQRREFRPLTIRIGSLAYVVALSAIAHGVWLT